MPDVVKSKNAEPIKNGTTITTCTKTGEYSTINTYASPLPDISSFDSKYANRFDDPSYYHGNGTQGS